MEVSKLNKLKHCKIWLYIDEEVENFPFSKKIYERKQILVLVTIIPDETLYPCFLSK